MNIVKIDIIQPQPRKRGVKFRLKIGRAIVEIAASCFLINGDASLGSNVKKLGLLCALFGQKAANDALAQPAAINISGVNVIDPKIKCIG